MNFKALTLSDILDIHDLVLKHSAGLPGVCPDMSLDGALHRINDQEFYASVTDLFEIAALYGIVIAQGHVFTDANKRTAFISMCSFLEINGYSFEAQETEAADVMVKVAEKKISYLELAEWLKKYSKLKNTTELCNTIAS